MDYMDKVQKEIESWKPCPNCKEKVSYELLRNNKEGVQGCLKCLN